MAPANLERIACHSRLGRRLLPPSPTPATPLRTAFQLQPIRRNMADSCRAHRCARPGGLPRGGSGDGTATIDDMDGGIRTRPAAAGPGDGARPTRHGSRWRLPRRCLRVLTGLLGLRAGFGYGYNPWYGSSGYTTPNWTGYTNPYGYGSYGTVPNYNYNSFPGDAAVMGQQSGVTQSMYMSGNAPARVSVIVPTPDAQVWFGDTAMPQTRTTVREFVSPPLEPARPSSMRSGPSGNRATSRWIRKRTVGRPGRRPRGS